MNAYRSIVLVLIMIAVAPVFAAAMSTQEKATVFQEANVAFGQANKSTGEEADRLYEKAILNYLRLIEEGSVTNAKLFANLGNAYLMTGQIGRAILWYRRAIALEPGNTDIARSLSYARSRRVDKVEPPVQKRVLQTLFFWHYDFSTRTRFVISCVAAGALCLLLTVMIWMGRRAYFTAGAAAMAILLVMMAASLVVETAFKRTEGVIIAAEVVARQGDGLNYPEAFKEPLHAGTEFVLTENRPGWIRIELADSSTAWIQTSEAELF